MAEVEVAREGAVQTITLNRPEVLNAFNRALHKALREALKEARDPEVRAVVLTGAGRGFSAGQDLKEFGEAGEVGDALRDTYHPNVLAIRALEKPVIAAVNGVCAGAGLSLACVCDFRIAADDASFVPGFIGIGLVPDAGGTFFLHRLLGASRAFEWMSSNRRLSAAEAHAWGLVSEVVEADALQSRAAELAASYAALPTRGIGMTKRLFDHAAGATLEEQLELEAQLQAAATQTEDFREGVAAFLEKREPAFTGAAVMRSHPIHLVVTDDLKRWRLTVALRWLLALPHLLVLALWTYVAFPVTVVNWFIALVRGRPSPGVHAWTSRLIRYQAHVYAYVYLVAEPYPSFRGWPGRYPVDLAIAPPTAQARWKTLLRIILVIPAYVFATVLGYVLYLVAFLGAFYALATGRYPKGFRDLSAYCLRFQAQTFGYLLLVTDRYPTLSND
jgi:2-(1,2-epoxy-1,2-dihydrophenyl)acetyl-CoA isomerase